VSPVRIVRGADLAPVPWRNGMGTTRDVATAPAGVIDWQVSIADLARDAPFSDFSGMDRTFTIVEGAGVTLTFGAVAVPCPPLVPVRFPGGAAPACRLVDGPGRAFNVFADARRFRSEAAVLRVAPDTALTVEAGTTLLHCVEGRLHAGDDALEAGDTLMEPQGVVRTGAGAATLIAVTIAACADPAG
jgi:uncharacterized protein